MCTYLNDGNAVNSLGCELSQVFPGIILESLGRVFENLPAGQFAGLHQIALRVLPGNYVDIEIEAVREFIGSHEIPVMGANRHLEDLKGRNILEKITYGSNQAELGHENC